MNWFKSSQANLSNFTDRNLLNERIEDLKAITVRLVKASKLAAHTQTETRGMLRNILESKRLSTYPKIQELIEEAEKVCMDSPVKVAALCKSAASMIVLRVTGLEKERKDFIERRLPDKWKGWRE